MKIAFYNAKYGDWTDKLVSFITHGPYSHCELIFENGLWFSASMRDGGVRFKNIELKEDHWEVIPLNIDSKDESIIYQWAQSKIGLPYNYLGLFSCFLPVSCNSKYRWFCSEICVAGLHLTFILSRYKPCKISPNKLNKLIERIINGK